MANFTVPGDVELRGVVTGEGPTVLLLHGWPDTAAMWDEVTPWLVEAGYRVAAVDLRGCGGSDKPRDVASYAMGHLVDDVVRTVAALGVKDVILVGHDWGAALAWAVAAFRPALVRRLVVVSVGHPSAFRAAGIDQQRRSWYMLLFYHEGVGEAFLRQNDYEALRRWSGHPRADAVIDELERDGQMTTHLLWYRANVTPDAFVSAPPQLPPITMPVLGLWSRGDPALGERQMKDSAQFCARGFTFVDMGALGHWIPLEAPVALADAIIAFCEGED